VFLHVELPAGDTDEKPVGVGLVPLILPVEIMLDAGAGVAAAAEPGPVVSMAGAGVSEEELVMAAPGVKVVVAVGTPLASTSTEMMSVAETWTVTSTAAVFCRGSLWRESRLCRRPISRGSPPSFCRLDGYTIAG
jgi:hypothetical protein